MAEWFRRSAEKIKTFDKRDTVEGMWVKCPRCTQVIYRKELEKNNHVCPACSHHFNLRSDEYLKLLLDNMEFEELGMKLRSIDPLKFSASKKYADQLTIDLNKTGLTEAIRVVQGQIGGCQTILAIMDFSFIGGSIGSVVGERIRIAVDAARKDHLPLVIITASGGARMQEGAISLMQMAKTSAKLAQFSNEGGFYISILSHPTTGGTTASFAMLGDLILAEPNALIGFAGKRVIKATIGEELPDGFQRAEFLLEKGFLDNIVHRRDLKTTLVRLFKLFGKSETSTNETITD